MNLLDKLTAKLPFSKNEPQTAYFFGLDIGLASVTGAVWEVNGDRVDIIGQKTTSYTDSDDLFEKANLVLDQALGAFEVEPKKILFGVPESWMAADDLKEPYLKLLRRMVKEYDLEPMAYVSSTQALIHFLQKSEGVPPTAILVAVDEYVGICVVRGGKILGSRSHLRSDDLFADIEKALLQFTEMESLPSKVLLYSASQPTDQLQKTRDELNSHHWMQRLPFLHIPKIDLLPDNSTLQAVLFAGAIEINPHLNLKHSFSQNPVSSLLSQASQLTNNGLSRLERMVPIGEEGPQLATEPIGEIVSAGEAGLVRFKHRVGHFLSKVKLPVHLPNGLSFLKRGKNKRVALTVGGILLLVAAYLLLPQAKVNIYVEPKVLTKDAQVIVDPKVEVANFEQKIIPGHLVESKVSGSGKGSATGKKQIGDPAKGQVIIYNKTNNQQNFSSGTTLTGPNGLKFSLDQSVAVASQSSTVGADFTTVISPGKSPNVGVTASTIGPDSNLSASTDLTVGSFSSDQVVARVDVALSGGTSKEVTVVTTEDQKKLQVSVLDELKKKAQAEISSRLTDDQKIVAEAFTTIDSSYSFSKQVNDQAVEFTLNANAHFRGTTYQDSDLKTIVAKLVETNVPDDYQLDLAETETQADVAQVQKDGKMVFLARFKAKLLPKFDTNALKGKIRGKGVLEAAEELRRIDNIIESEINLTPPLPPQIARLPLLDRNISITVSPK